MRIKPETIRTAAVAGCVLLAAVVVIGRGADKEKTGSTQRPAEQTPATPGKPRGFGRMVLDIGIVASDVDKSIAWYKALGFKEGLTIDVGEEDARDSGFSDGRPLRVRTMSLGEGPDSTNLKFLEFKDLALERSPGPYIHSALGVRYITIAVDDIGVALAKAAEHGIKPIEKGPIQGRSGFGKGFWLALLKDPDGNIVEMVSIKKS